MVRCAFGSYRRSEGVGANCKHRGAEMLDLDFRWLKAQSRSAAAVWGPGEGGGLVSCLVRGIFDGPPPQAKIIAEAEERGNQNKPHSHIASSY